MRPLVNINGRLRTLGRRTWFWNRSSAQPGGSSSTDLQKTDSERFLGPPLDLSKAATIEGQESQIVVAKLPPYAAIRAEAGNLVYMSSGVEVDTTSGGGFGAGFKRMLTGQRFFVSDFVYKQNTGEGEVAIGANHPSRIMRIDMAEYGNEIICTQGAFLCGSPTINVEMFFVKSLTTGFLGGQGFILQKLTGDGYAFIKAGGALLSKELEPGEVLRCNTGGLVAFENSIHYDIQRVQGLQNMIFGAESLFLATLTGPGRVYLQGLPFDRICRTIESRLPRRRPVVWRTGSRNDDNNDVTGGGMGGLGDTSPTETGSWGQMVGEIFDNSDND